MTDVTGVVYALRVQSVFPESRMISDFLPENGFPRQCAHCLGMTLYLGFVYTLKQAGEIQPVFLRVRCAYFAILTAVSRAISIISLKEVCRSSAERASSR